MNVGISARADCALTVKGVRQAQEVAWRIRESIRAVDDVPLDLRAGVVSPYRRALQTAAIIADITGIHFGIDHAVREWGKQAQIGDTVFEEEPIEWVIDRLSGFVEARKRQRLVVAHGTSVSLLTQRSAGETLSTTGRFWDDVENCCLRHMRL